MPVFKIHHITKYEYDRPVSESVNEIKIFPVATDEQEILSHEIIISPTPDMHSFYDYWGNKTGVFNILPLHPSLVIESKLLIRTTASSQLRINFHTGFEQLEKERSGDMKLIEFSVKDQVKNQPGIDEIVEKISGDRRSVATVVERCAEYIYKYFNYRKGITNIETTVDEILAHRGGVCQDFAHLMLQVLATLKIPSRYVSGYICPNKNGMRGEGATHAWVEAYIPGYGWAGIDPTNNVWVTNNHIKLAVGRHFNDCTPVKGTFKGPARQKLSVYVSIGYEDGHVFEEVNNVQMETQAPDQKEELIGEHFAGQQQQ
ncbi:MAG TPA: transglutaminase family protein [Panacibacter sp.]|nr:transglutaminase family protein [Panacibacter sp.]HNP43574.1 transglutaminase family protein [Panacibacter sp.]